MPGPAAPRGERRDRCPDCGDAGGHSMTADTTARTPRSGGGWRVTRKYSKVLRERPLRPPTGRVMVRMMRRGALLLLAGLALAPPAHASTTGRLLVTLDTPAGPRAQAAAVTAIAAGTGARRAPHRARPGPPPRRPRVVADPPRDAPSARRDGPRRLRPYPARDPGRCA